MRRFSWFASAAVLFMGIAGCGGTADTFDRHPVSGVVTFDGAPVPRGSVWFEPDASVGNMAPTGFAQIRDGQFQTKPSESPVAGRYHVRIVGYDGQGTPPPEEDWDPDREYPGSRLFSEYTTTIELDPSGGTLELEVPAPAR